MNHDPIPGTHAGLRVLVIDDDHRVQKAITVELTAVGWHPTAIGPQHLTEQHPVELITHFDVALVDVALPTVTDGLAVITQLAARLPVVAFSINGAAREAALAAGAAAYAEKDGDTERLLRTLHTATRPTDVRSTR